MLSSNSDNDDFIKVGGVTREMCVILQNAAHFHNNASASWGFSNPCNCWRRKETLDCLLITKLLQNSSLPIGAPKISS